MKILVYNVGIVTKISICKWMYHTPNLVWVKLSVKFVILICNVLALYIHNKKLILLILTKLNVCMFLNEVIRATKTSFLDLKNSEIT